MGIPLMQSGRGKSVVSISPFNNYIVYDVKQVSVADMPTYCCMYKFSILLHFLMFFSITMQTILSYSFFS